jgi:hypothetical protein
MGNSQVSTHCESPGIGGNRTCPPPEPLLRCAIVVEDLLGNYRSRGMPQQQGAEALRAIALNER